jgi:hypothetical protein
VFAMVRLVCIDRRRRTRLRRKRLLCNCSQSSSKRLMLELPHYEEFHLVNSVVSTSGVQFVRMDRLSTGNECGRANHSTGFLPTAKCYKTRSTLKHTSDDLPLGPNACSDHVRFQVSTCWNHKTCIDVVASLPKSRRRTWMLSTSMT